MPGTNPQIIIDRQTAAIAVDMQNDFGHRKGSLFVAGGDTILATVNLVMSMVRLRIFTRDQHPAKTSHFKKFPPHCVIKTWGARFLNRLNTVGGIIVSKGTKPDVDDFSGCDGFTRTGVSIAQILERGSIQRVIVCGLATDFCVLATVLDLLKFGYVVYVVTDGIAAVNLNGNDGEVAISEMKAAGAIMVTSDQLAGRGLVA